MAAGLLGKAELLANAPTALYTVPADVIYTEISFLCLNPSASPASLDVYIGPVSGGTNQDYIEKGVQLPASGGVLERSSILCSPGERIVFQASQPGVVIRVMGVEKISA